MRAHSTSSKASVPISSTTDDRICQSGGVCTTILPNIRMGAKNGISDIHTIAVESGVRMTGVSMNTESTNGITPRNCICCPSCSVVVTAPIAAYIVLYSRYPSRKNIAKQANTNGETIRLLNFGCIASDGSATTPAMTIQTTICVNPTAPTPRIFPAINSVEVADESSTSMMREFFSSSTDRITEIP